MRAERPTGWWRLTLDGGVVLIVEAHTLFGALCEAIALGYNEDVILAEQLYHLPAYHERTKRAA